MDAEMQPTEVLTSTGAKVKLLKRGVLEVIPAGISDIDTPASCKSIVISAGVHGNETAPLELVDQLVRAILADELVVKERCLFILAHPLAINNKTRFIDENLNRLFRNDIQANHNEQSRSLEIDIAQELMEDVSAFFAFTPEAQRWHLDLHCAIRRSKHFTFAVSPCTDKSTRTRELFTFADKAHLGAVLLSHGKTNTFSCYSANHHGAKSLTVELGQVSPLGQNDLSLIDDFNQALHALLSQTLDTISSQPPLVYRVCQTLQRTQQDFDFTFADDVENFTRFQQGEVLGHDGTEQFIAKQDGEAVVFPNKNVAINSRAALMVIEVETHFQDDQLVCVE